MKYSDERARLLAIANEKLILKNRDILQRLESLASDIELRSIESIAAELQIIIKKGKENG